MAAEDIEKQIIEDAKKRASQIINEAEETVNQIYRSSLEYVEDMLTEVNTISLRAKDSIRILMESMLEEYDSEIDQIEQDKIELIKLLNEVRGNGRRSIKKENNRIKSKKAHIQKQTAKKPSYEIKIAEEWKDRIEQMMNEQESEFLESSAAIIEEEEPDEYFKASDFNLDSEYFEWLKEKE